MKCRKHRGVRAEYGIWLFALWLLGTLGGCARKIEVDFSASEAAQALPASHQEQIKKTLEVHFGTPQTPRILVFAPPDDPENAGKLVTFKSPGGQFTSDSLVKGADVYFRNCAACHGVTGDGAGAAADYLTPKPRDYRRGTFKFTSTPFGAKPRRQDLIRIIVRGARGTSMPSFRWMPDDELQAVVDYVMLLSLRGELEFMLVQEAGSYEETEAIEPEIIQETLDRIVMNWNAAADQVVSPATAQPSESLDTVALGKAAFLSRGCAKCHGADGRGQTQDNVGKDIWGHTVKAADLTSGMLHGGHRPIDIYRRIYSGINGTPMPAFKDALATEPDTVWHLVHFVRAVAAGKNIQDLPVPEGSVPTEPPAAAETTTPAEPEKPTETEKPTESTDAASASADSQPESASTAQAKEES